MLGYLQLLRPLNCTMTAVAVLIGSLLVLKVDPANLLFAPVVLAMVAAFLITGAGNAINDYVDIQTDKVNRPRRPIPSGRVSKRSALAYTIALFAIGILLAGMINWVTFIIAIVNSFILIVYTTHLKSKLLVGNAAISYLVGSGFLFGGAAVGTLVLPLLMLLLAGMANMAREIIKDLQDIEGDRAHLLRKLTHYTKKRIGSITERFGISSGGGVELKYGRGLKMAAGISLVLAIAVSPLPYALGILGLGYLILLIPTDIAFLATIYLVAAKRGKKWYGLMSKGVKVGMLLGLLAFLLGIFI